MKKEINLTSHETDAMDLIDEFMRICRQEGNVQLTDTKFINSMHKLYNNARKLGF